MFAAINLAPGTDRRQHRNELGVRAETLSRVPSRESGCASTEREGLHHRFNPGSHLLSRNAVGCLIPAARGTEDGPSGRSCQQFSIDAGRHRVISRTLPEHVYHHRDDGTFEGHLRQLTGTTCGLSEIIANTKCDGSKCTVAVREG